MRRVVLFGDSGMAMARSQVAPFLRAIDAHPGFEAVAVIDTARRARRARLSRVLQFRLTAHFNPDSGAFVTPQPSLAASAEEFGVEVRTPPERNVNSEEFRSWLSELEGPLVGVSLGCLQIFKQPLLDCFEQVVNHHNGLLPDYRGLGATSWSLYNGETRSGYSYHRMTAGLDDGAVLADGSIEVDDETFPGPLEDRKFAGAAKLVPRVLEAMDRLEEGRVQVEEQARVYTGKDRKAIQRIEDPASMTADEIRKRLRCFSQLRVRIDGSWWPVTEVSEKGRPRIPNADGVSLGVHRASFYPVWLYRAACTAGLAERT